MSPIRIVEIRTIFPLLVLLMMLAACGSDSGEKDDRSFAPETKGESTIPTNTPAPTSTLAPLDLQPGEDASSDTDGGELFDQSGPYVSVVSGLNELSVVDVDSGEATPLSVQRSSAILVTVSPDGQLTLIIDRTNGQLELRLLNAKGDQTAGWSPSNDQSPVATPTSAQAVNQTGDRVAWTKDSSHAAFWIAGVGLFVADRDLQVSRVTDQSIENVTAIAWSPTGQSIAIGLWHSALKSASIVSVGIGALDATPSTVIQTADGDGRFVRSLAWGNERVGLVFTLRSTGANMSQPNDLYMVPRFGEPMRLLASAGVAAPAAVVDHLAIANDGSTVAFSVLVPGEVGMRFHSVWVTDASSPSPFRATTIGLRRISDLVWTEQGLVAVGTRRGEDDKGTFQLAVVERLSLEAPKSIAVEQSAVTPVGSPIASPVAATPETGD